MIAIIVVKILLKRIDKISNVIVKGVKDWECNKLKRKKKSQIVDLFHRGHKDKSKHKGQKRNLYHLFLHKIHQIELEKGIIDFD